jgi:hypothetical protein
LPKAPEAISAHQTRPEKKNPGLWGLGFRMRTFDEGKEVR